MVLVSIVIFLTIAYYSFANLDNINIATGNASALTTVTISFPFTGKKQSWSVPHNVIFPINFEVVGAAGGTVTGIGGRGAVVTGKINSLPPESLLHLYVGEMGRESVFTDTCKVSNIVSGNFTGCGSFNGGGLSTCGCAGGGGASDIRIGGFELTNRIIVAGGGGGGSHSFGFGGHGGDSGYDGSNGFFQNTPYGGGGAFHTSGGAADSRDGFTSSAGYLGQGGGIQMWSEDIILTMNGNTATCYSGGLHNK